LHDLEAVFVIAVQNAGSHECEDWHDISENGLWGQVRETRDEKEGLVESLGVVRHLEWRERHVGGFLEKITYSV
jgi:hypothetical protein